ncbi:reverse transcriptase domain-containing protein [Streptomyces sp. NPDC050743]|uniref:reverse transcriptase domain-containing protein n=1 Tax=Streptomyces sp. NPDC050743 TaxID=3365634 RepID=UPI0037B294D7
MGTRRGPVSAGMASPAVGGRTPSDKVRALQHALYRSAKADPGRRFHALGDKIHRRDVLRRAWAMVRANNGAPGIDRTTLAQVEEYGIDRLLGELADELRQGRYRSSPARRVFIPKPGVRDERRPLSVPTVRDRIVQAAMKIVLEPVFEADMLPCSFGFRPKRSAHDALQVLIDEHHRGRRWVVETDIAECFSAIPHEELMRAVEERVCDQSVLKLLRQILRAGVMEDGQVRRPVTGTPQGGVSTPPTQWITQACVTLCIGGVVLSITLGGPFSDGDTVSDRDLFGADEDVFDQEPQDALPFGDLGCGGVGAELGEEAFQVVGEFEVGVAVGELGFKSVELAAEVGLAGSQVGHPGAQFVDGDQLFLVGLDHAGDGGGGLGQGQLEAGALV